VSTTVAPGGVGKSSLAIVEALAIATGRPLLGIMPNERTKVWLYNGEDSYDELQRRVAAVAKHFDISPRELEGWLFLDTGQRSPILLTDGSGPDGTRVASLEGTIVAHDIGVLILDPFVSLHRLSENDNNHIDRLVKALAGVAARTQCAVEVVHHTRKTNGTEVSVEDGRGASALLNAVRSARVINPMSDKEARDWGVDLNRRRSFFRAYSGKSNFAPPSDQSTWFELVSAPLGNGTSEHPEDWIGVVTRWHPPKAFDHVTHHHMQTVWERVANGEWRMSDQSPNWVGEVVADVLRLDVKDRAHRKKIKGLLATWIGNGLLKIEHRHDDRRRKRPFIVQGEWKE
jgi:hypothetical protein